MNKEEHLINRLAEESVELAKECNKALSFGIEDRYGQGLSVKEKIIFELNDLLAVVRMLQEDGILPSVVINESLIDAKIAKVNKYMLYAEKAGTLVL